MTVAERDQALVAAAVVPEKVSLGHVQGKAVVQNALQIFCVQVVLIHRIGGKEGGGRHLIGVAYYHCVSAPGQRAHCLAGGKLGCLVEHHQIKGLSLGVQVLGGGDGAHKHTGAQPWQQVGNLLKQPTDAYAPAVTADGPL